MTTEELLLYRARKGDVVAIERRHSSTFMHGRTERSSSWHIGRAESVARNGVVKTASADLPTESGRPFPMLFREYDRDKGCGWSALTIADARMREAAAKLVGREFATVEALRAAIVAAAEG